MVCRNCGYDVDIMNNKINERLKQQEAETQKKVEELKEEIHSSQDMPSTTDGEIMAFDWVLKKIDKIFAEKRTSFFADKQSDKNFCDAVNRLNQKEHKA